MENIANNLENLSKEELINLYKDIEGERNKRLKADIQVAHANKLLENENTRIKSIQKFIGDALQLKTISEIYELTIETIIESFECENALFLSFNHDNQYKVVYDFSFSFEEEFVSLNKKIKNETLLIDNQKFFKDSNVLNNANGMLAHIGQEEGHYIILAYTSKELIGTYELISEEHLTSFEIVANQIGSVLKNLKITKEIEELNLNLENKVKERTQELLDKENFVRVLLDSQEQIIITTDGVDLKSSNSTFLKFFNISTQEEFDENCICDKFDKQSPTGYLQKMMEDDTWINYVINNPKQSHKAQIIQNGKKYIFSVNGANLPIKNLQSAIFTDITAIEEARTEIEELHHHTRESIEYASLIQNALIPDKKLFEKYFSDYLTIWEPKDIVGGDIYLCEELRHDNEVLIMVIDCTGHGVPGAFVTMLVKAIERQIAAIIASDINKDVSPAQILEYCNKTMKYLLKQESEESISNAGFDGGILYYNKELNIIKYAGAETPLFYKNAQEKEYTMIKGDRHSIGYKQSNIEYKFKEHNIMCEDGMQFYITTDGYIDQNGGEKGFPFGKKRFKAVIDTNYSSSLSYQKDILFKELLAYQEDEERNDDITVIGIKI